jgi:hypothetical protein
MFELIGEFLAGKIGFLGIVVTGIAQALNISVAELAGILLITSIGVVAFSKDARKSVLKLTALCLIICYFANALVGVLF